KKRRLDGTLLPLVRRVNLIRRENPAFQRLDNIEFVETENEQLIAYLKREADNAVFTVVNLDPFAAREGVVHVPVALGLPPAFGVRDMLTDTPYSWRIGRNYVRLDPGNSHIMRVEA